MYKFFVDEKQIKENKIYITGKDVNHIKNVLRLEADTDIEIGIKQTGASLICSIYSFETDTVICNILKESFENKEAGVYINIVQALPKGDKMELIIQKCTELGVKEITPLKMERCVVKLDEKTEQKKISKWRQIAESAAKQCARNIVPKINNVFNLKNLFQILQNYDIVLVAYEEEQNNFLKQELEKFKDKKDLKIAIIIGPEGGIDKKEVEILKEYAKTISLGKRILRTETVSFVVTSIVMYEFGDLGGNANG